MAKKSKLALISIGLSFSFSALAGTGQNTDDYDMKSNTVLAGMTDLQRGLCDRARASGNEEMVMDACVNSVLVGRTLSHSNVLAPIDIKEKSIDGQIGRAMAVITFKGKKSEATQVCKGIYFGSGHGVSGKDLKPDATLTAVHPYPFHPNKFMTVEKIDSPYNIKQNRTDPSLDFAFLKVTNPTSSDFVPMLATTSDYFINLSNSSDSEKNKVHLYRSETIFSKNGDGSINYNLLSPSAVENLLIPRKVTEECKFIKPRSFEYKELTSTNCPSEGGVSGARYISTLNKKPYIAGLHIKGRPGDVLSFKNHNDASLLIDNSKACKEYEKHCGKPCTSLRDALSQ